MRALPALYIQHGIHELQQKLLALAPRTRTLDTLFDPALPPHPVVAWIREQKQYIAFSKPGTGPRLLYLHTNGDSSVDISELSRLFYLHHDFACASGNDRHAKSVVYFEFDRHDSRYNSLSSLLLYLLNTIVWHMPISQRSVITELGSLNKRHPWSLDEMFHIYSAVRRSGASFESHLTIFIGCFDQCPEDQRQWFLERLLEEQAYSDMEDRIVLSSSAHDGLSVPSFLRDACINLNDSPALQQSRDALAGDLRLGLNELLAKRPVYGDFAPQLDSLIAECENVPHLGRVILAWLTVHHRGKPRSEIAERIRTLSPPTAETVVRVFVASLAPSRRTWAETVFNWVKIAAEPWSPGALTEALAVHELGAQEPLFEDLDVEATMSEIEESFCGIVTVKGGDVKFSHESFYRVPELGCEKSKGENAAKANSILAAACLGYFQFECAQKTLARLGDENVGWKLWDDELRTPEEASWASPMDSIVGSHPRTGMAEYAARFWNRHYSASGGFKPRGLVKDLFASKAARAGWEMAYWLLSNPFTRIQRGYTSQLPVLAMLGLEDEVQEKAQNEGGHPAFQQNCWFAITEAARAGHGTMVQRLLRLAEGVDEAELGTALHWAASRGDTSVVKTLLDKIVTPAADFPLAQRDDARSRRCGVG